MRRSLFVELLRQQLVTALIPILLIGGVAALVIFPRLEEDLINHHQALALSVSDQVSSYLNGSKENLKLVALDIINNPNASLLSYRLDGFVQVSSTFETVYVTGTDGKIDHIGLPEDKVSTRRLFQDMDVSFSTLWEETFSSDFFAWSNIFVSPISGNQSVALQTKLGGSTLIAEVDILSMPALAGSLSQGNLVVMILDERATLIGHPDPEISQQQLNLGYSELFTNNLNTIRSGLFQWYGDTFHATVVPLAETGWQVVVAESDKTFMANIDYLIVIWGSLAFITLLISSYFAYQTARHQSLPFTQLKIMTQKVSGGNYDVRGIKTVIEEIGAVSDAFVFMANTVKKRESELTNLNTELEGRVEARTAELLSINEELSNSVMDLETTMEQLVQSEKLASLGSLVAGVAHELNTPIGNAKIAVSSQQDYLREINKAIDTGGLTKSMLNQFVEDIGSTADMGFRNMERASELIRSFKQIAVDQTSSHQRTFNLATLLNEVLVTLRPTLKKNPVQVDTQIPTSIEMTSVPGPLSQILTNLINNAVFHGIGDKESISIHIEAEEVNGTVLLIVQDTGIGMPKENIKKAFDPFFTTKMGQGGSGLGLNIVHRMVTGMLHGTIELSSIEGSGTTFHMTLPKDITHLSANLNATAETPKKETF
jgi:signal transduction histidine kinase